MAISCCTICKKQFKSSQIFIQHLQTSEHRKKVEMVQEDECQNEELSKIPDGFLVEEEGGVSGDEDHLELSNAEEENLNKEDGEAPKEVTLEDMDDSVQYNPDVLYGGKFFVPVAGFICRLCNKFYHFESSDLHSHCKSLEHFENLKRFKTDQKYEARTLVSGSSAASSRPVTELSSRQVTVSVCRLHTQAQSPTAEPTEDLQPTPSSGGADTEQTSVEEAAATSVSAEAQDSQTVPAAATTDSTISNEENVEAPKQVNGKKGAKTTTTPRRRTSRTTNRR
ncbi:hypothetical protein WMY93_021340 [Mugilogobius chulae]|uniref:Matrin-type domain-containing protein n=1 Tax=Mugilogobius chulae TaxID=88201 RepID=A0AAW0NBM2_9GOBI